jgi:arylsulfatase A-like enzyme
MKGWDALREERLERQVKMGLIDEKWQLSDRAHVAWDTLNAKKKKDMDMRMAYYAAMIDRMDQNIGNLIKHLKATGELDNTLILFMSDNGACQEGGNLGGKGNPFDVEAWEDIYGSNASYGMVWANASNTPFRMFKHFTHEGGLSTPLIMHWPEQVKKTGGWYKEPAYLVDIMPTLLDVSGAKYPKKFSGNKIKRLTGVSLKPALTGKSLKRKSPLFFEHEDNAAIMMDNWKLVGSKVSIPGGPDTSKWELYNLSEDRTETRDLSGEMPELREKLAKQWLEWANKVSVYPKPAKRTND